MSGEPLLLGDIGGTHARFALSQGTGLPLARVLEVADHPTPEAAIAAFLADQAPSRRPRRAALACAGPVEGEAVSLTNSPWRVEAAALRHRFDLDQVILVNDFGAVAWALPVLPPSSLRAIGGGSARRDQPAVVLGPGTGLGVAAYLPGPPSEQSGGTVIVGEGGHGTMPAADDREAAVLSRLRTRLGHVSAERVISGNGLVNLYETIAALEGLDAPPRSAAEISDVALAGSCGASRAALDMFCDLLGTLAGNMALTTGAAGGVYIAGGIVPRVVEHFATSGFRDRFEAKGRFRTYLQEIPTYVILQPELGLLGLQNLARRTPPGK